MLGLLSFLVCSIGYGIENGGRRLRARQEEQLNYQRSFLTGKPYYKDGRGFTRLVKDHRKVLVVRNGEHEYVYDMANISKKLMDVTEVRYNREAFRDRTKARDNGFLVYKSKESPHGSFVYFYKDIETNRYMDFKVSVGHPHYKNTKVLSLYNNDYDKWSFEFEVRYYLDKEMHKLDERRELTLKEFAQMRGFECLHEGWLHAKDVGYCFKVNDYLGIFTQFEHVLCDDKILTRCEDGLNFTVNEEELDKRKDKYIGNNWRVEYVRRTEK